MLESLLSGLFTVLSWPNITYVVIGAMLGMVFGAVPGLGGPIALALLIPLTFWMDPTPAMILFGATLGGVAFGGSISAILINTPGTAPNAATCFDGFPMTQQGRGNEALGISATSSALGAVFGLVAFILIIPFAREIILLFGPPEFFWLAVLGLTAVALTGSSSFIKGLAAGGVGLVISVIGFSGISGEYRFGYGTEFLWGGIELIPALIGLFAIAEVIRFTSKGGTIANSETRSESNFREVLTGVRYALSRKVQLFKASIIGLFVGAIPGAGGTVANFISYIQAVQTSNDPQSFGKGNPDGVIASEAANDAKDGGSLLPTVVFGIPGSASTAVLLGAFILHGLNPGTEMVTTNLSLLFVLVFALVFANLFTSIVGILTSNQLTRLTYVDVNLLAPAILSISLFGAFAIRNSIGDVAVALVFGLVGFLMVNYDYSRIALILALILGPIAEDAFLQSRQMYDTYLVFVTRPISLILLAIIVLLIALPVLRAQFASPNQDPSVGGQ